MPSGMKNKGIPSLYNLEAELFENLYKKNRGGYPLILAMRGRAAGQGMVIWARCPKQGVQFDLPLT